MLIGDPHAHCSFLHIDLTVAPCGIFYSSFLDHETGGRHVLNEGAIMMFDWSSDNINVSFSTDCQIPEPVDNHMVVLET